MAWIGLVQPEQETIRPVASPGNIEGYLNNIHISTRDVSRGRGPTTVEHTGKAKYYFSNDISSDPCMEPWRENALKHGYRSNASFPFALGTKKPGVLNLYAPVTGFFDEQIIDLLEGIAIDISFALRIIDEENERKSS